MDEQKKKSISEAVNNTLNKPKVKEKKGSEAKKEEKDKVIYQTGEEASIASMIQDFDKPLSEEELGKVITELEAYEFVDPKKTILDEVKKLHPQFKVGEIKGEILYCYKYRFINMDRERLTEAFGTDHWKPVNRTNHPNIPSRLIRDGMGAIIFEDQMLCFRERQIDDRLAELDYARHTDRAKEFDDKAKTDPRFYETRTYTSQHDPTPLVQDETSENREFTEMPVTED